MAKRIQKIPKCLTKTQIKDFLNCFTGEHITAKRNLLLTKTYLRTGARTNEILNMRYEDLLLNDEGEAFYHLQKSKNGSQMQMPLPADIYEGILDLSKLFKSLINPPINKIDAEMYERLFALSFDSNNVKRRVLNQYITKINKEDRVFIK